MHQEKICSHPQTELHPEREKDGADPVARTGWGCCFAGKDQTGPLFLHSWEKRRETRLAGQLFGKMFVAILFFFHSWFMTSKAPTRCFSSHLLIPNFADIKTSANSGYFCTYFLILFYPMCIVLWNKERRIFIKNKSPLLVPCSRLGFSSNPCFCHEITPAAPPHKNATCTKIATSKSLLVPICRASAPNPAPSLAQPDTTEHPLISFTALSLKSDEHKAGEHFPKGRVYTAKTLSLPPQITCNPTI